MKLSYNWLQEYFGDPLPEPEKLSDLLTFHSYEVESIEEQYNEFTEAKDWIFDVDVLPNRAADSLCHRGVAREIATLLDREIQELKREAAEPSIASRIAIQVQNPFLCRRYAIQVIEGVRVGPSPSWLTARLASIGEKSINNVVDITNLVMFDIGQPLHAFDLDKIKGERISVRSASEGEKMTTLDGEDITFEGGELVIADSDPKEGGPLALAGVKGGAKAAVDEGTTRIALEAAHFDSATVRRATRKWNIFTHSSRRFENGINIHGIPEAMDRALYLLDNMDKDADIKMAERMDMYDRLPSRFVTGVSDEEVNARLGTHLLEEEIQDILRRARLEPEGVEEPYKKIAEQALQYVGTPYKYGASITYDAPRAFDCSSLVAFLFAQAGVSIPRMAVDQLVYGRPVEEQDIQLGDIVFSKNEQPQKHSFEHTANGEEVVHEGAKHESVEFLPGMRVEEGVSHNGVYIGEGKVVHAHPEQGVIAEQLSSAEKFAHIVGIRRVGQGADKRHVVTVPHDRPDVKIPEDVVEEVGRIYGYHNIEATPPSPDQKGLKKEVDVQAVNKEFFTMGRLRAALKEIGFSEVHTYSFQDSGNVEVANPPASDKKFLRSNLEEGLSEALDKSSRHAPLLDSADICIFEIGTVFTGAQQGRMSLGVAVLTTQAVKEKKRAEHEEELLRRAQDKVEEMLGVSVEPSKFPRGWEINITDLLSRLPEPPETYGDALPESPDVEYAPISLYPFVLRDVAAWTPAGTSAEEFAELVKAESGELLAREPKLFDEFEKGGRVSYAFNLVFQSQERTLTDEEVNKIMNRVYAKIEERGWEAR